MLFPITLLPLVALTITDTQVRVADNAITVDVALSEPLAAERVRAMTGPQRMYVFVPNATSAHRTYTSLRGKVVAHERSRYTKLEIPTTPGGRCYEPVLVEGTPTGVRLRATCGDAEVAAAPVTRGASRLPPTRDAEPVALPPRTKTQEQLLREAIAPLEPSRPAEPPAKSPAAAPVVPTPAVPAVAAATPVPAAAATKPTAGATPTPAPTAATAPTPSLVPDAKPAIPGTTGGASLLFVVLVIGGLGVAAYYFGRRRRPGGRMIKIMETASIGPKRSLVVASIGGRTLILGVSEAGVALLDTAPLAPAPARLPAAEPAPEPTEVDSFPDSDRLVALRNKLMTALTGGLGSRPPAEPEDQAPANDPGEKTEQGILGRIFAKSPTEAARREHEFRDLLEDSYEDQELRRRLSMGVGGRVA